MNRRSVMAGLAAIVVAAAGGAAWKLHLFKKHYAPTPYDDLLNQIVDRDAASRLGAAVVQTRPDLNAPTLAQKLRQSANTLAGRAARDASQNRLIEAGGWIVPESVGLYSALAAKAG
jgi:hypothetical protein